MQRLFFSMLAVPWIGLSGCMIQPQPEDVTPYNTNDIVRRIRCETREALRDQLIAWLQSRTKEPKALELAQTIKDRKSLAGIKLDGLSDETLRPIGIFSKSAIAYSFTFDMTYANNNTIGLGWLRTFSPNKTGTFGIGGTLDRSRNNKTTFTIADTFSELVTVVSDTYCRPADRNASPNYIYPISGKIGIEKQIWTFVDMTIFDNLAGDKGSISTPRVMSSALDFETTISGNIAPVIVLKPPTTGLTTASLTSSTTRTDKHEVTLGFALPVETANAAKIEDFNGKYVSGRGDATIIQALKAIEQFKENDAASRGFVN